MFSALDAPMLGNTAVQLGVVIFTTVSTSGVVTALLNRKSKKERAADVRHTEAEYENISAQAAATALAALRKELDAANVDLDKRRTVIQGQDQVIDRQQNQLRKMRRYVEACQEQGRALEDWVRTVFSMLETAGNSNVPPLPRVKWPALPEDDHEYDFDYLATPKKDTPAPVEPPATNPQ